MRSELHIARIRGDQERYRFCLACSVGTSCRVDVGIRCGVVNFSERGTTIFVVRDFITVVHPYEFSRDMLLQYRCRCRIRSRYPI